MNGDDKINFPDELLRRKDLAELIKSEAEVFDAERMSFREQLDNLSEKKKFLEQGVVSLKEQLKNNNLQRTLAAEELAELTKLVDKKIVILSRQKDAQRNVYELDAIRLRLEAELIRTSQAVFETSAQILTQKNDNNKNLLAELSATEAEFDATLRQIKTSQSLLDEAAQQNPIMLLTEPDGAYSVDYLIIRLVNGVPTEMAADDVTMVQPGDTVKVALVRPDKALPRRLPARTQRMESGLEGSTRLGNAAVEKGSRKQ